MLSLKTLTIIIVVSTTLFSCHFYSNRLNDPKDKEAAEKVINEFYKYRKLGDTASVKKLFTNQMTTEQLSKFPEIFDFTLRNLGKMGKMNMEGWQTKVMEGVKPSAEYFLSYKNIYDSAAAEETFKLGKENDTIKIFHYNINSNAFLKK